MKKIKTLYKLDSYNNHLAIDEVLEGSEWVIKGEGDPYLKLNGTCCAVINGVYYKRFTAKNNVALQTAIANKGFILVQTVIANKGVLSKTHSNAAYIGWVPVTAEKNDVHHMRGFDNLKREADVRDGTYELIGKNIQGNDYKLDDTILVNHKDLIIKDKIPTDFEGLKSFLEYFTTVDKCVIRYNGYMPEGIVWHNGDNMVKIRRSDFRYDKKSLLK
jgi:hypothetical protein